MPGSCKGHDLASSHVERWWRQVRGSDASNASYMDGIEDIDANSSSGALAVVMRF